MVSCAKITQEEYAANRHRHLVKEGHDLDDAMSAHASKGTLYRYEMMTPVWFPEPLPRPFRKGQQVWIKWNPHSVFIYTYIYIYIYMNKKQ